MPALFCSIHSAYFCLLLPRSSAGARCLTESIFHGGSLEPVFGGQSLSKASTRNCYFHYCSSTDHAAFTCLFQLYLCRK